VLYVLAESPLRVESGRLGSTVYEVIRIRSVEPPATVHHPDRRIGGERSKISAERSTSVGSTVLYVLAESPLQVECGRLGSTVYEVIRIRSVEPPATVHHPDRRIGGERDLDQPYYSMAAESKLT
jgi:hypothetical protein